MTSVRHAIIYIAAKSHQQAAEQHRLAAASHRMLGRLSEGSREADYADEQSKNFSAIAQQATRAVWDQHLAISDTEEDVDLTSDQANIAVTEARVAADQAHDAAQNIMNDDMPIMEVHPTRYHREAYAHHMTAAAWHDTAQDSLLEIFDIETGLYS